MPEPTLRLSIVVPVYRGERFLAALVDEIEKLGRSLESAGAPIRLVETIFVDDCAVDGSAVLLERLAHERGWLRTIRLAENGGQHFATATGLAASAGDWVVTLDEDGQHPPRDLLRLLEHAVQTGSDLVYAAPQDGVHRGPYRDLASGAAKGIFAALAGEPRLRRINSFRLMRGEIARLVGPRLAPRGYLDVHLVALAPRLSACVLHLEDPRAAAGATGGYGFLELLRHARRLYLELRAARRTETAALRAGLDAQLDRTTDAPLSLWLSGISAATSRPANHAASANCSSQRPP